MQNALLMGGRFILHAHWIRFCWINAKFLNRFRHHIRLDLTLVSQGFQRGNHHKVAVDLKEMTQLGAGVTAAKTFGAQYGVIAGDIAAQLLGVCLEVIRRDNKRIVTAFQTRFNAVAE